MFVHRRRAFVIPLKTFIFTPCLFLFGSFPTFAGSAVSGAVRSYATGEIVRVSFSEVGRLSLSSHFSETLKSFFGEVTVHGEKKKDSLDFTLLLIATLSKMALVPL